MQMLSSYWIETVHYMIIHIIIFLYLMFFISSPTVMETKTTTDYDINQWMECLSSNAWVHCNLHVTCSFIAKSESPILHLFFRSSANISIRQRSLEHSRPSSFLCNDKLCGSRCHVSTRASSTDPGDTK